MPHRRARLGALLPVLAFVAACDADRVSNPTAAVDVAPMPNAAAFSLSCAVEGTGPYTIRYEWSGLSVYQLRFLGPPQDLVVTLKHPTRRSDGSITLAHNVFAMTLWSKRGDFLGQTFCTTPT